MPREPTAEEMIETVRMVMSHPAALRVMELDAWGHGKGLKSEDRTSIVNEISAFYAKCPSLEVGKEYVTKAALIVRQDSMPTMLDLSKWAIEKSIPEDACKRIVNAIMTFYVGLVPQTSENLVLAVEYVEKAADVIAAVGPSVVGTLRQGA